MVIGFMEQCSSTATPIYVVLSRTVSQETVKKLSAALDKVIARYGEKTNGDYSEFDICVAIDFVMNKSKLKWHFMRPDVFIYY